RDRPLRARIPTAVALLASPVLLLASPYGLQAVDYYHRLLLNPAFSHYVTEWRPTYLGIGTTPFYVLAVLAAWLAGRCRSRLTLSHASRRPIPEPASSRTSATRTGSSSSTQSSEAGSLSTAASSSSPRRSSGGSSSTGCGSRAARA